MGTDTKIEWAHHTFNPWSGCEKVSAGCANCYAAALPPGMRRHAEWGKDRPRVVASESYWRQPLTWNRAAAKAGERHRVFCASTADVFEANEELDDDRARLFFLVKVTPHLDWLLLTKRPEYAVEWWRRQTGQAWPANAWIGTSVEDQRAADERIPHLLKLPARVRFLSCEPLLGAVDLDKLWCHNCETDEHIRFDAPGQPWCVECDSEAGPAGWLDSLADERQAGISWVIVGGESGRHARPMHPDWPRALRDQCTAAGVAFFMKQMDAHAGADKTAIPADLMIREIPHAAR